VSSFAGLIPELRDAASALFNLARDEGLDPIVTSVRRSYATQKRLYDLRQRTLNGTLRPGESPQNYPVAFPGTSDHEIGWAFDMVTRDNAWLGAVWKSWGGYWSPGDSVHFYVR